MQKKSLFTLFIFILFLNGIYAGNSNVKEVDYKFNHGVYNALEVFINYADEKAVMKAWKKRMKKTKGAIQKSKGEVLVDDGILKKMSDHPLDIYAGVKKEKNGLHFYATIDFGGAYLSSASHPEEFKYFKNFVEDFAKDCMKKAYKSKAKAAKKQLKKEEKSLGKMEKNEGKLKDKIKDLEKDIQQSQKEQAEQKKLIEEQKNTIKQIEKEQKKNTK